MQGEADSRDLQHALCGNRGCLWTCFCVMDYHLLKAKNDGDNALLKPLSLGYTEGGSP